MKQLTKWLWQLSLYFSLVARHRDRAKASEEAARIVTRKIEEAAKSSKAVKQADAFFETLEKLDRITEELSSPKTKRAIETLGLHHGEIILPVQALENLRNKVEGRR